MDKKDNSKFLYFDNGEIDKEETDNKQVFVTKRMKGQETHNIKKQIKVEKNNKNKVDKLDRIELKDDEFIIDIPSKYIEKEKPNKYNIKHIWTRIFSVYGPYDGEKTMIMSSIKEMLENKKSPNYTKGEQIWDYIYSEDVAKAFYLIGEKGKNNSVYCIAQGESRPLYEYIQMIKDAIDKSIKLNLGVIPYSEKQVMNLQANIDKLKIDTGFIPEYTFEKGIQNTIKWYKEKEGKNEEN